MTVKLLTEHILEFLSSKRGCTGSHESTFVKMPHCWKSHVAAQLKYHRILSYSLLFFTKGHSIEAGWFLLQYATKKNLTDLKRTAIEKFIQNPFKYGWDEQYGGLYYYMDVDGHSPVQVVAIFFCFVNMSHDMRFPTMW